MATKTIKYAEDELVALLKQNQRHGFEYLYENYSRALFGVISRIVPDEDKAADIMQEVFLKIWQKIGDFDSTRSRLYTWMITIARNTAIDQYRLEKDKYMIDIDQATAAVDLQQNTQYQDTRFDVHNMVNGLKPERKVLLDMVYLQGYTQEEAATRLMIPLGTAKSRIRLALQELKNIYSA